MFKITTARTTKGMATQIAKLKHSVFSKYITPNDAFIRNVTNQKLSLSFDELLHQYEELGGIYKGDIPDNIHQPTISGYDVGMFE